MTTTSPQAVRISIKEALEKLIRACQQYTAKRKGKKTRTEEDQGRDADWLDNEGKFFLLPASPAELQGVSIWSRARDQAHNEHKDGSKADPTVDAYRKSPKSQNAPQGKLTE